MTTAFFLLLNKNLIRISFLIDDPYEETNLATNSDYASILADLESKVDVFADGIYTFETSGTCLESEVLDADNNWITGCCNYV